MKKSLAMFLIIALLITSSLVFATDTPSFSDLPKSHWSHEAVITMVKRGILSGYPDGSFKPDKIVNRAEFAKMMVVTLDLKKADNQNSVFKDVESGNWALHYINSAKDYLTGYKINDDLYFKPDKPAQREDMAVALVRALGYDISDVALLDNFADGDAVSQNLKPYVATAVSQKLLKGYPKDGEKLLMPQRALTRAEASQLLLNIVNMQNDIVNGGEKVLLTESAQVVQPKPCDQTHDNQQCLNNNKRCPEHEQTEQPKERPHNNIETPHNTRHSLKHHIEDDHIVLDWSVGNTTGLKGYKVVASKHNAAPAYPADGYYRYISNPNQTSVVIDSTNYHGGDIKHFVPGEKYYFSITALYNDEKVALPAIEIVFPEAYENEEMPENTQLIIKPNDDSLVLKWHPVRDNGFKYYKVVASLNDSTPQYPENGYAVYIDDVNRTDHTIYIGDHYNNGDFAAFEQGQTYYFAITAVYDNYKTTSNVIKKTLAGTR